MLLKHMREVYHEHVMDGSLQEDELRRMSAVLFRGMDTRKTGKVTCSDFIHAFADGADVDVRKIARFFSEEDLPDRQLGSIVGDHLVSTCTKQVMAKEALVPRFSVDHAPDCDELLPAAGNKSGCLELRLAALEGRITALEARQKSVAAIDLDSVARDCLFISNTAGLVETLHRQFQTMKNDVEGRLRTLERVFQKDYRQDTDDRTSSTSFRDMEQPQKPDDFLWDDQVDAVSEQIVSSVSSSMLPTDSMTEGTPRKRFATQDVRSANCPLTKLPLDPLLQCNDEIDLREAHLREAHHVSDLVTEMI